MRRSSVKFRSWCIRNKRNNLVFLVFGCAVCMLLWRTSVLENDMELEVVARVDAFPVKSLDKITSAVNANSTYGLRRQHAIEECRKTRGPSWSSQHVNVPRFKDSPIISTKHNLMYCPVGKVASSFFTRFILVINQPGITSPYDIPIEQAGRGRCESLKNLRSPAKVRDFLESSMKVVFGRNPYSRIFSAYIDKLFSPNPFYWKYWGERAMKLNRTMKRTNCASEVTFQQFVRLVLRDLHRNDVHLRQVYVECHMCDVIYDVIGKLETTEADLDFLSSKLNISSAFQHEERYVLDSKMDIVYDSVKSAFRWKQDIAKCMALDQMGLRIWRKLQIRGVLDSSISYPFKPGEIEKMPVERFIAACKSAILASTDKAQLKKQKNQALLEAYSTLNNQDLLDIVSVYNDDFRMFEYEPKPARLFGDRSQIAKTGFLNWRTDWVV